MIKLNNVIDELEVKNNKLSFENKILNNKIDEKTDQIDTIVRRTIEDYT